jgi:UDP-N-acetylmuramyl tripeptide synthase
MNDFYRNKTSLPREVKNASTLREALKAWKEKRLLNVVSACRDSDNLYRKNFSVIHQEYADAVDIILTSAADERETSETLLEDIESRFKVGRLQFVPGWIKDASGLCGAELEKILSLK